MDIDFQPLPHDYIVIQDGVEQVHFLTQAEAEALSGTLKNGCPTCEIKYLSPGNFQEAIIVPPPGPSTGLDFPGNVSPSTVRFRFPDPHLNGLPLYPATYIWKVFPRQQAGYYTTFFWGPDDGTFVTGNFYGFHPYPQPPPAGTDHKWSIAADGDYLSLENVVYDRWYTQAAVVWDDGTNKQHQYFWDLTDTSKVVIRTAPGSYGNGLPPSPALTWGDAPWSPSSEVYNGIIRGMQVYNVALSLADIQSESITPLSTTAGQNNIWYLNENPIPTDITDKSGMGNNPEWVGSERPALWSGTPPPVLAHCEDGIDNDSDGLIDLADPGCVDSSDTDEFDSPPGAIYSLPETDFTGTPVVAGNFSVPGQSLTIDFEITPRSYPTVDTRIISKAVGQQQQDHYFLVSMFNGKLRFRLKTNGNTSTLIGNAQIPLGVKTVGQVTYDGVSMKIFVNDVLDVQSSKAGDMDASAAAVWVGGNPPDNYSPFDGLISVTVN